jgi:nitrogen fixation/metabolism regulation signal transduction histidine kinase
VQRATPKILASLTRAVNLTESTLAFGRAEEPSPKLERVRLADIAEDVVENERLTSDHATDECLHYLYLRGARRYGAARRSRAVAPRAVEPLAQRASGHRSHGQERRDPHLRAVERDGSWRIEVCDTGPACRKRRSITCSKPFHGGARKGGTGLGLAIAAEIIRGHGGTLELVESGPDGHDLRDLPSRGPRRLTTPRGNGPARNPLAPFAPTLNPALTHR